MHGIPPSWVSHASLDELLILWKVVQADMKDQMNITAGGIGVAFGGDK